VTTLPASSKPSSEERPEPVRLDPARPVTDHLEELRWRIIFSLLVFAGATVVSWMFVDRALLWLARPVGSFIFTTPAEAFLVRLKLAASIGVIIAFPFLLYQVWSFVEVALEMRERTLIKSVLPASCGLFYLGGAIALFGVVPLAAHFLLAFGGPALRPMITLDAYLSFVTWMIIGFGLFFQLPLAIVALSRAGIVNPWKLTLYRKHAVVFILIAAAVLTPGPDIISQLILATPSYLLFEISLIIAKRVYPKPQLP
jgi:sec-independent protein translocase protein TatC